MAEGSKLICTFLDAEGKDIVLTYDYADATADRADIRALVAGMIANGAIFENVPVTAKSAKIVTTTETVYSLSA